MGHDQIYILKKSALDTGWRVDWNEEVESEENNIELLAFQNKEIMIVEQDDGVKIKRDFQPYLIFRLNQEQFQMVGDGYKEWWFHALKRWIRIIWNE